MNKIANHLKEGLGAKIVTLCYLRPRKPWQLAKVIYHTESPRASKIYTKCKELSQKGYLEDSKEGKRSKIEPILEEVKLSLGGKDIKLSEYELELLRLVIGSSKFRDCLAELYEEKNILESNKNIVSIIFESLSRDGTIVLISRRAGRFEDPSSKYKSQSQYLKLLQQKLPDLEASPILVKLGEEKKAIFESTTSSLRKLGDIVPNLQTMNPNVNDFESSVSKVVNYLQILNFIPKALLQKIVRLDSTSAEIGVFSALVGGGLPK